MSQMPDFCQTSIKHLDFFTFDLPVTAFGFDFDMILEFCVEYWKSPGRNQICANVWVRQKQALVRFFAYSLTISECQNPDEAIIEALNCSEEFNHIISDLICETTGLKT